MPIDAGRRSTRRTTIPTSGWRRSRVHAPRPGSSNRTRAPLAAFGGPAVEAGRHDARGDPRPARQDPVPRPARAVVYNFWNDAAHPRGLWRRTTPESFRSDTPAMGRADRPRRAGDGRGRGLDLGGAGTRPVKHDRAIVRPVARRQRCGRAARVRSRDEGVRGRRLRPARGQGLRELDRRRHLAARQRLWRRRSRPRATPAPCGCGGAARSRKRRRCCSRCRPTTCRPRAASTAPIPSGRSGSTTRSASSTARSGARRRQLDLPTGVQTSTSPRLARDQAAQGLDGRRHGPGRGDLPARHPARRLSRRRPRLQLLFEPQPRRVADQLHVERRAADPVDPDNLDPVFEVLIAAATAGRAPRSPACRASAWSMSGRSTSSASEANGELLASTQDPLSPSTLLRLEPGKAPTVLKRSPPVFAAEGLVVTRHEAVSVDGERIPYVQTGPATRDRRRAGLHDRLRRLRPRLAAVLQLGDRQAVAGARRHQRARRTSEAAASSACRGTRRGAAPASG